MLASCLSGFVSFLSVLGASSCFSTIASFSSFFGSPCCCSGFVSFVSLEASPISSSGLASFATTLGDSSFSSGFASSISMIDKSAFSSFLFCSTSIGSAASSASEVASKSLRARTCWAQDTIDLSVANFGRLCRSCSHASFLSSTNFSICTDGNGFFGPSSSVVWTTSSLTPRCKSWSINWFASSFLGAFLFAFGSFSIFKGDLTSRPADPWAGPPLDSLAANFVSRVFSDVERSSPSLSSARPSAAILPVCLWRLQKFLFATGSLQ